MYLMPSHHQIQLVSELKVQHTCICTNSYSKHAPQCNVYICECIIQCNRIFHPPMHCNEIVSTSSIHSVLSPDASAPRNLMAVQEGPTSVRLSWSPPSPLGDTTGYRISYSGDSSGSGDVSDGSTSTHTLTGLRNGASYTISIVGTSLHLPSEVVEVGISLGELLQ